MKTITLLGISLLLFTVCGIAQQDGREMQQEDRLSWWRESRFGMSIHWVSLFNNPSGPAPHLAES